MVIRQVGTQTEWYFKDWDGSWLRRRFLVSSRWRLAGPGGGICGLSFGPFHADHHRGAVQLRFEHGLLEPARRAASRDEHSQYLLRSGPRHTVAQCPSVHQCRRSGGVVCHPKPRRCSTGFDCGNRPDIFGEPAVARTRDCLVPVYGIRDLVGLHACLCLQLGRPRRQSARGLVAGGCGRRWRALERGWRNLARQWRRCGQPPTRHALGRFLERAWMACSRRTNSDGSWGTEPASLATTSLRRSPLFQAFAPPSGRARLP